MSSFWGMPGAISYPIRRGWLSRLANVPNGRSKLTTPKSVRVRDFAGKKASPKQHAVIVEIKCRCKNMRLAAVRHGG